MTALGQLLDGEHAPSSEDVLVAAVADCRAIADKFGARIDTTLTFGAPRNWTAQRLALSMAIHAFKGKPLGDFLEVYLDGEREQCAREKYDFGEAIRTAGNEVADQFELPAILMDLVP